MIKIKSVRDLGVQFKKNPHRMVGQDGAFTIPTRAGLLWFFGDTLIGERRPGESLWYPNGQPVGPSDMSGKAGIEKMLNNSGLLSGSDVDAAGIVDYRYILDEEEKIKNLIPLEPGEDPDRIRVWCLHGVEAGGRIYLYFIKIETIPEGILPVNFGIIGSGLAVGDAETWRFERIRYNGSDIWWGAGQPHFASAVLRGTDGYLYLYGALQGKDKVQRCFLARVREEDIGRFGRYEYLCSAAPAWSRRLEEAIPLYSGMPNEQSVSYNPYLGRYLAVHSQDLSGKIVARTALEPWGPWTAPEELYQVNMPHPAHLPYPQLIYAGKEHPALARENGRKIYVTFIEFEEYYPHLLEITFV
jgi:hypothetical protein